MGAFKIFSIFSLFVTLVNADSTSLIVKYKDSCDKLDIDNILKNQPLVNAYMKCLLNQAPCTKYGKEIKSIIPEIVSTTCENCSPNQKRIVQRIMHYLHTNRKSDFDTLLDIYDPEKKYRSSMMNFMTHADHVSDTPTSSNGTLHKHLPRRSPKPTPPTAHQSSTTQSSDIVTPHKSVFTLRSSRSPRFTQSSSKSTSEPHRAHIKAHTTSARHIISSTQTQTSS